MNERDSPSVETSSMGSPLGAVLIRRKEVEKGEGKEDSSMGENALRFAGETCDGFSFTDSVNDGFSLTGEGKEVSWIREGKDSCSGEGNEVS